MGANRILHGVAINHPTGWPQLPRELEQAQRRRLAARALDLLATPVEPGTIWEPDRQE